MTAWHSSALTWGLVALLVLTVELAGWSDRVPWNTLTWTIRQTFAHYGQLATLGFVAAMAVFVAHILYRKSKKDQPEGKR